MNFQILLNNFKNGNQFLKRLQYWPFVVISGDIVTLFRINFWIFIVKILNRIDKTKILNGFFENKFIYQR